jgi:ABC-type polysaccharide/polyol phosphate export permease
MTFGLLDDVHRHWDLVVILATSNLKASQKNTFLGYLWWLLDPVMLMFVYWILMAILARGRMYEAYPAFVFCSLIPWKFLKSSVTQSVGVFSKYESLIKRVPFPKIMLPVSMVVSNFVQCMIGLIPLVALGAAFGVRPTWHLVLLPIPMLVLLAFVLGITFFFSAFGVLFRDLEKILDFWIRLWWYLSPGMYAIFSVPERYRFLLKFNPVSPIFQAMRAIAYYPGMKRTAIAEPFPTEELLGVFIASIILIWVGYVTFRKLEHQFAKVL